MKTLIKNCILKNNKVNILIEDGVIVSILNISFPNTGKLSAEFGAEKIFDFNNCQIIPGLTDVHVHFREPGFFYKETIETGSRSAFAGGFTTVCTMANLNPVPDSVENINKQIELIEKNSQIQILPLAAITIGEKGKELVNFEELNPYAIGFSDDGKGIQSQELMRAAMERVKALDGIIVAHCEDESLLHGGYIHKGTYAEKNGHKGICSESEWKQIERDLELVKEIGCRYHVCHISTKEGVDLIRKAKADGLRVTCETAPHYLHFTDEDIEDNGRFKMNPPLRSKDDQKALIEGLVDGTIEVIATDHAPHSQEEKDRGLSGSAFGVVGLETAFGATYTALVEKGLISMDKLVEIMSENPRKIFKLDSIQITEGEKANFTIVDTAEEWTVNPENFETKGRATPFNGTKLKGKVKATFYNDNLYVGK